MQRTLAPGSRRHFLCRAGGVTLATVVAAGGGRRADSAEAEKVDVAFMGLGPRGRELLEAFLATGRIHVSWLCDVDRRAIEAASKSVAAKQVRTFKTTNDFRKILDDRRVHALVVAAPDHWHVPAALLALKAGKAVYLESPPSHGPREGEWLADGARRTRGLVQVGLHRRSVPWVREVLGRVRSGEFGPIHFTRAWHTDRRPGIGFGRLASVPEWLDYDLWQAPAPARPLRDNLLPGNWRWFWHWGTGELGVSGVHLLDLARWGLGLDCPVRVASAGGRYHFEDDQESPDTQVVTFDFGHQTVVWEHRSCLPRPIEGESSGIAFHGDRATVILGPKGFRVLDPDGKETQSRTEESPVGPHVTAFLDGVVKRAPSTVADADEAHRSMLLCHLGNISHRLGRSLRVNPETRQVRDDREAVELWRREYRSGWQPGS